MVKYIVLQCVLAGVFNMLGYLDEGLGDLDDSLLIQVIVASGLQVALSTCAAV